MLLYLHPPAYNSVKNSRTDLKPIFHKAELFAQIPKFLSNYFWACTNEKILFARTLFVVRRKVETSPTFSQIPLEILLTRFQVKMAPEQQNNLVQQISLAGIDFKALLRQVSMANEDPKDGSHPGSSNISTISCNAVDISNSSVREESRPVIAQNWETMQK